MESEDIGAKYLGIRGSLGWDKVMGLFCFFFCFFRLREGEEEGFREVLLLLLLL